MIRLPEARSVVEMFVTPLIPERRSLDSAIGRVLAEDVLAPTDFPSFDRSAVDGYAVNGSGQRFRVVGTIQAGESPSTPIAPGECVRIYTGAMVPAEVARVVMQEDVTRQGELVTVDGRSEATHIRRRGEDTRGGALLIGSGTRLRASEAALLAQIGVLRPLVSASPRVSHVVTGSELVAPDRIPGPGNIRDSNSTLVAALLAGCGGTLVNASRCSDTVEALIDSIEKQPNHWEMLLISGGASVGDYDFGKRALRDLGFEIHFEKVDIRPGKPLIFGTRGQQVAFVVPGNPVAHLVTFHLLIRHALECFERGREKWALTSVELVTGIPSPPDARETWWPSRVSVDQGRLMARPLRWQSSGDLCGIVGTNGLVRAPSGSGPYQSGALLECLLLDHRF